MTGWAENFPIPGDLDAVRCCAEGFGGCHEGVVIGEELTGHSKVIV